MSSELEVMSQTKNLLLITLYLTAGKLIFATVHFAHPMPAQDFGQTIVRWTPNRPPS